MPVKISLDLVQRVEDHWFYEMVLMIPPSELSMTIALMKSDLDGDAEVTHVKRNGLHELDEGLLRELLVRLFKVAYCVMADSDGSAIQWWIADVVRLLEHYFFSTDIAEIRLALHEFVEPDHAVQNLAVIRID